METLKTLKVVVAGDSTVGKTSLLISYAKNEFAKNYEATVFDNYSIKLNSSVGTIQLDLFDTAGNEGYEDLRTLAYTDADIILLCFAVDNTNSLEHVKQVWYHEIKRFCPNATIILVVTKSDLRSKGQGRVSTSQIEMVAKRLRLKYMECSALTRENVKEVFELGMKEALSKEINEPTSSDGNLWKIMRSILCCKRRH